MSDNSGYGYARKRAAHVVRTMLQGGASEDAAAHAGDRVFQGTLDVHTGAKRAPAATAAHMTREIRTSDAACRYADHKSVTGALHAPKMRVRRQGGGAPSDVCGPRMATPGVGAAQIEAARAQAVRTVRECAHMWATAQNGAVKRTVRDKLRAILHVWGEDRHVIDAITWEGFDVARLR